MSTTAATSTKTAEKTDKKAAEKADAKTAEKAAKPDAAAATATPDGATATAEGAAAEKAAKPDAAETDGEPKERQKVYIVVGPILEFKNASEAEKFLNKDPSAPAEFTVIKGKKVEKKAKVSLR